MDKLISQVATDKKFDVTTFNHAVDNVYDLLQSFYVKLLKASSRLNALTSYKSMQFDFYKSRIDSLLDQFNDTLLNRYQNTKDFPLTHLHYIDQSKSSINIDASTGKVTIFPTDQSYKIPADLLCGPSSLYCYIADAGSELDSSFIASGSSIENILNNYYNYFRFVARSKSHTNFTCTFRLEVKEQDINSILLALDNYIPYIDRIKVSYKNTTTVLNYSLVLDDYISSSKVEAHLGDTVSSIKIEITKNSHDAINFEEGFAFFDYYFTIKYLEFFNNRFYRQNVLVSKPLSFGDTNSGSLINSVKLWSTYQRPAETDVKFFYYPITRDDLGLPKDIDFTKLSLAHVGNSITLIPHEKVVISSDAITSKSYNANYAYLSAIAPVTKILNGNIFVFKGLDRYKLIGSSLCHFWVVYLGNTPIELDVKTYSDKGYLDTGLITTNTVALNRGAYKMAVDIRSFRLNNLGLPIAQTVEDYFNYIKSLSKNIYIAKEKMVFGLPSEVLYGNFNSAFTLLLKQDNTNAEILVSSPSVTEYDYRYLIFYDRKK